MLEYLVNQGFAAELYSVDRTTGPYDTLISGILTDRVDFYVHAMFMKEMKNLRQFPELTAKQLGESARKRKK